MTLPNRSGYSVSDVSHSVNNANQTNMTRKGQPMVVAPPSPIAPPQLPMGVYGAPPGMYNPVQSSSSYEVMKQHFTGFVPPPSNVPIQPTNMNSIMPDLIPMNVNTGMEHKMVPYPPPENDYMPTQKIDGQTQPSQSNKSQSAVPDNFSLEEVQARKNYVRSHRLLPNILEVLNSCRKEGMLWQPIIDQNLLSSMMTPLNENGADVSLEDFLHSQGIETGSLNSEDIQKNAERQEFIMRLDQIKEKYHDELERLNRVCNEFCFGMLNLLREQLTIRPVTDQETQMKLLGIQYRFHNVKNKLRQNVFSAILALHKQFNQTRKKKRMLPKKATESLSQWFFDHINDPYPSEEEKNTLAAAAGLTLTQVNNWFGNKRIRYKRKCLEEDSKVRTRRSGQHQGVSSPDSGEEIDFSVHV